MAVEYGDIYGIPSENCPEPVDLQCYVECEHVQEVIDEAFSPHYGDDELFIALFTAILYSQDLFVKDMCEWTPDICTQGAWMGFPCVQCGVVTQPGYGLCSIEETYYDATNCPSIVGTKTITYDDPCISSCQEICEECVIGEFDFRDTPEGIALYDSIITTLRDNPAADASLSSINATLVSIWGAGAEVTMQQGSLYQVYLGRAPTDLEKSITQILARALPLPVCSKLALVDVTIN